ncbi:GNAT family N-acetyltransferase [uncultured Oscillibacter sp.]|uniref:GNAT family N-acetyltransferase n=1 Tax=uncultured Oscillibacter sp. TaxID=876091 RepID=UPI0025CCF4E0|nr:GNAT family N-acetyltransferase [uncultured Oscillibacter sp.]
MHIRPCTEADLPAVLDLFHESVHTLCRADYTPAQLAAWAPADLDSAPWARRLQCQTFLLAEEGGALLGFASREEDDLDLLYVHPRHAHRGVGTVLCDALERRCTRRRITVHASLTARPFFAHRGYRTVEPHQVERRGVVLTNYLMEKELILWT